MRKDYPEQFTLFVKSWQALYTAEKKHPGATYRSLGSCSHFSYYAVLDGMLCRCIGGIHGKPYERWEYVHHCFMACIVITDLYNQPEVIPQAQESPNITLKTKVRNTSYP